MPGIGCPVTALLLVGLFGLYVRGFRLPVRPLGLAAGLLGLSLLWGAAFARPLPRRLRLPALLGGLGLYALLLTLLQGAVLRGASQTLLSILRSIDARYQMTLTGTLMSGDTTLFLLAAAMPLSLLFYLAVEEWTDLLPLYMALVPPVALWLLAGTGPADGYFFCLIAGLLGAQAASGAVRKRQLWGERDTPEHRQNHRAYTRVRLRLVGLSLAVTLLLLPLSLLARPLAGRHLAPARQLTARVEGAFLGGLVQWLPQLSGGTLRLETQVSAGGVRDGALNESDGYVISGVEDLQLTLSQKPGETLYLRGWVGNTYQEGQWRMTDGSNLLQAATGWHVEGAPELYLYNLPFLRTVYIDPLARPVELTVTLLSGETACAFLPYGVYLSDLYTVRDGDGAVTGGEALNQQLLFFPTETLERAARLWESGEEDSILRLTEESYARFARWNYCQVPPEMEALFTGWTEGLTGKESEGQLTALIREYLLQNYRYDLNAVQREGLDPLESFLTVTKTGYSAHFASAAVLLYRLCGIPARYVTGYAAPQGLFTAQPDGSYRAVLQDDNAHAWAEIYLDGIGWQPREMTPGILGTTHDVAWEEPERPDPAPETPEGESAPAETPQKGLSLVWLWALAPALLLAALWGLAYGRDNGLLPGRTVEQRYLDCFSACCRRLHRRGMPREVDSGDPAFGLWLNRLCPGLTGEERAALVGLAYQAAYSNQPLPQEAPELARKALKGIRRMRGKKR